MYREAEPVTPSFVSAQAKPLGKSADTKFARELAMKIRSSAEPRLLEEEPKMVPYMDVRLRSDLLLHEKFVERLHDAGMIAFTDRPLDLVTPFFVEKKGGLLRLVWDCRSCNRRFRASDPMSMPSGTTWAAIELQKHEKLHTAQSDVKDFFPWY